MRIARSMLDQMVAQARDEAPNECCGIVGSRDGRAVTLFKARNARASPLAYDIDGRDLQRIYDEIGRACVGKECRSRWDWSSDVCSSDLGSRDGRAVTLFKARNARASPLAYDIDGRDLQRIYD